MTAIFGLLKSVSLKTWLIIGLVIALGAWSGWQWSQRKAAEVAAAQAQQAKAEAERDREAFKGAYNTLAAVTQEQNRAVQSLKDEGEKRAKEGAAALAKATADSEGWRRSADRLRAILAAPQPMTCDEAVAKAKDAL